MELCPKCDKMTAERNLYTKKLKCYSRECSYDENDSLEEKDQSIQQFDWWNDFG